MPEAAHGKRAFGSTILLGLASGALVAVSGAKPWAEVHTGSDQSDQLVGFALSDGGRAELPAATSLALVALACWGVILVTRGRVRRAVGIVAVIASAGVLAAAIWGLIALDDDLVTDLGNLGTEHVDVGLTGWAWAGTAGAVLLLLSAAVGVLTMRAWPEMGTKYDAPNAAPRHEAESSTEVGGEQSNIEVWKAIDAGHDPTL